MRIIHTSNKGIYGLVVQVLQRHSLQIGRLGKFDFPAGFYVYVGSAQNLLPAIRQIFIISKNNRDALSQFPNRTMLSFLKIFCMNGIYCRGRFQTGSYTTWKTWLLLGVLQKLNSYIYLRCLMIMLTTPARIM